jgi:hypothetical protein
MTRSPSRPDSESRSRSREHIVNIIGRSSKSKSRSRSREPAVHAAGRGGAGNMVLGGPSEKDIQELDESERSSFSHELGVYVSTSSLECHLQIT